MLKVISFKFKSMENYNPYNDVNLTNLTYEEKEELSNIKKITDIEKTKKQKIREIELKLIYNGANRKYVKDMAIWEETYKS